MQNNIFPSCSFIFSHLLFFKTMSSFTLYDLIVDNSHELLQKKYHKARQKKILFNFSSIFIMCYFGKRVLGVWNTEITLHLDNYCVLYQDISCIALQIITHIKFSQNNSNKLGLIWYTKKSWWKSVLGKLF